MKGDGRHSEFLAGRRAMVKRSPHTVYIHRDADGRALYVGTTYMHEARQIRHSRYSAWAPLIARVEVDSVQPTRTHGRLREAELIRELRPPHNRQIGNVARWRVEVALVEREQATA